MARTQGSKPKKSKPKKMTKTDIKKQALKLSDIERIQLAEELLKFDPGRAPAGSIPDWHRPLIKKALEDYRKHPEDTVSAEEFFNLLKKSLE